MSSGDDDERLLQPQDAADEEHENHVEQLAEEERAEDDAEADFEEEATPEQKAGHYRELVGRIHGIFAGDKVDDIEGMSADEQAALRVLAEAVRGKKLADDGDMIYAEHRMTMLNQALAVLAPTLAVGLAPELAELREQYDTLVDEVSDLRDQLERLGDAQEEMFHVADGEAKAEAPDTDDDDDKPKPVPEPGEPPRPSMLAGKPGDKPVDQPSPPSTLAGKASDKPVEQPPRPSTLAGKAGDKPVEQPPRPSTLGDKP